jgi:hypothetical protein
MNRKLSLFAIACACVAPLAAVVMHDTAGLEASRTVAEDLLAQPGYAATGWVEIVEGASRFRGTGVLLANNWVLTAGHNWLAGAVTGLTFHHQGLAYAARPGSWIQHPGWTANPQVGLGQGSDLGLFQLEIPPEGVTPASLYAGSAELGTMVTFLGAGSAGIGSEGPRLNPAALFYAGTNTIDRVLEFDAGGGLLGFDFDDGGNARNSLAGSTVFDVDGVALDSVAGASLLSQSSFPSPTALEATSAAGDSGAPVFADFGSGPELVGLVSWGVNPAAPFNLYGSTYGDVAYLTRVSSSRDWILGVIPEPGAYALAAGLAALGLLAARLSGVRGGPGTCGPCCPGGAVPSGFVCGATGRAPRRRRWWRWRRLRGA